MEDFKKRLATEIDYSNYLLESSKKAISACVPGLIMKRYSRTPRYYEIDSERNIIGGPYRDGDSRVLEIKKYRYLKQLIKFLESNLIALRKANNSYQSISPESVIRSLPFAYQSPIFPATIDSANASPANSSASIKGSASESLDKSRRSTSGSPGNPKASGSPGNPKASGSPGNPKTSGSLGRSKTSGSPGNPKTSGSPGNPKTSGSPGNPKASEPCPSDFVLDSVFRRPSFYTTTDGTLVRSLGEVIIYNALKYNQISFAYEAPITLNLEGKKIDAVPDFTIYTSRGTKYWEHVGAFQDQKYRASFFNKLSLYYENDIVLGSNLIITFSRKDFSIDSHEIQMIIQGLKASD